MNKYATKEELKLIKKIEQELKQVIIKNISSPKDGHQVHLCLSALVIHFSKSFSVFMKMSNLSNQEKRELFSNLIFEIEKRLSDEGAI